jgi:thiamine pyrophosphate-dependent acetolactate synthase large subunit-like protein
MTADQYACTAEILEATPDAGIVSNLGDASYVLAAVEDRPRNFYLWGSMGVTTPIGIGLALAVDEQVTVLDGDGSMLMGLGALSTVGGIDPPNLTVVVFDNEEYGTTGGQASYATTTDFAAAARACGVEATHVDDTESFAAAYEASVEHDGASLIACDVDPVDPEVRPPFDFAQIKRRVRDAFAADGT